MMDGGVKGQEVAERMILFQLRNPKPPFFLILPKSFINTELFPYESVSLHSMRL